ncbi:MAG: hypothetical protein EXR98_18545 [Gemmataceae bacterium]|nr:hypothetical protein [Gemmataceae bacterium]
MAILERNWYALSAVFDRERLPKSLGDDNPLKQVLMNLCLNARDAMPACGKLTIRTDAAARPGELVNEPIQALPAEASPA